VNRKTKLLAAGLAAASMMALGAAAAVPAHAAQTVTAAPAAPGSGAANAFPFGRGDNFNQMGFIYKNIPAFEMKVGDTIAFDLEAVNDVPQQMDIDLAATTVSGGDLPAGPFAKIVTNAVVPTGTGNTVKGDFDLAYRAVAPFSFKGGGLIVKFSNPSTAFQADNVSQFVTQTLATTAADPSGLFAHRFFQDLDGNAPWTGLEQDRILGFRVNIADVPAAAKKCKKKKKKGKGKGAESAAKKKKCKKKKKKKK
jgi:hypothetical protein